MESTSYSASHVILYYYLRLFSISGSQNKTSAKKDILTGCVTKDKKNAMENSIKGNIFQVK